MKFNANILFLSDQLAKIRFQLEGHQLTLAQAVPLRDDISTDEITPLPIMMNYDHRLGQFAHTGLRVEEQNPIAENTLRLASFEVLVGGKRYGKGSSREHSPVAEKTAGIRLIIAESFERIYRQNCDNLGLFTSTDMSLIARIQKGEDIELEDLIQGRDSMA